MSKDAAHNRRKPAHHRGRPPRRDTDGPRRDSRPRVSTSPRAAAFDVLVAVEDSDTYANLLLPPLLRERRIFGRDAALATELAYGTLRMQGRYDAVIAAASGRDLASLDRPVVVALRLGAHQLLGMRVPPHAAVSETVALARDRISAGPAQLINAVLRRISEHTCEQWLERLASGNTDRDLAVRFSHPEWILRAFRQALGADPTRSDDPETALTRALEANNTPPEVHLVLRPGIPADLAEARSVPGTYARSARYLQGGDPGQLPGLRTGAIGVQDEGSQLVTLATLSAPLEGPDATWLDLCAGPGGKAALMAAALADQGGGTFVANELHAHRARLVEQNLRAIPPTLTPQVRTGDGREVGALEPGRYDRVLLDAPCTGLGALRRRPESRWRRSPSDLPELTALQRSLLTSALAAVRPGGIVGYVTCSPHVAETALVVKDATRQAGRQGIEIELLDAPALLQSVSRTPVAGLHGPYAQLWPHVHGTDAMFLAVIRRLT